MSKSLSKSAARIRRHARVRAKINGTTERPRLVVFRSNTCIYAQIIDDTTRTTLAASSDLKAKKGTKTERATQVGKDIAAQAKAKNITTVVFDRAGYRYHGRIKALADAAREGGLTF